MDLNRCRGILRKHRMPYVRKLGSISHFCVWLVDGEFVRKNICEDFVNYDHHGHLRFIPHGEFWISSGTAVAEIPFYIDRMLMESRLLASGRSIKEASRIASRAERAERGKSEHLRKLQECMSRRNEVISRVHKRLLRSYSRGIKVWVVDGEAVRDLLMVDFAGGGHDKVYRFVPEGEIWIDDAISPRERRFLVLHEAHERWLMAAGRSYREAHWSATELEDYFRHHPLMTDKAVRKEIEKQS